jgi:type II secretory pathway component PulF
MSMCIRTVVGLCSHQAIIVVMGVTIATVMMSIYLPMFEMSGKVQ